MPTIISVTKVASAHFDIEKDTVTTIEADLIMNVIPVNRKKGIGSSIIFLLDGSNLNVQETVQQINELIGKESK